MRVNYETGAGSAFSIYGGNSSNLYASFLGNTSIKFPGLSASSGHNCLQIDSSGYITNTGVACGSGSGSGTVNSGSTGQIAYYNGTGAAVSGMSTIPVSAGGTGASTTAGALAALGGVSMATTTAQNLSGPLNASVNSQLNVMAFGAKGDCVTDDSAAIQAAFTASHAQYPWNPIYFPLPSGGCYLVSTLTWRGESLIGQEPAGVMPSIQSAGVVLKGKAGQDILHVPDPNSSSSSVLHSWSIKNISFVVDDSVDASSSFTHRWPGRWAADGAMTSGSAVLTSSNSLISCSDKGQNIQVNGAGASGANLVTTIASVSPCWGNGTAQIITLAASAATTVSGATVYVTPVNIAVTQHVGNCAIAADQHDGNSANWLTSPAWYQASMSQVSVSSLSGGTQNNSCGFFWQGAYQPYNFDNRGFYISRLTYGVVQAMVDTNTASGTAAAGQDYQKWDHGYLGGTYPWISYNGSEYTLTDIQLASTNGPQVLQAHAAYESNVSSWYIRVPEFETASGSGWRIEGSGMSADGLELCGSASTIAYLDTTNSTYRNTGCTYGTLNVYGNGNSVDYGSHFYTNAPNDYGEQNQITGQYLANPFKSHQPTVKLAFTPSRGSGYTSGVVTPDFITSGNAATPYPNQGDLMLWPEDMYSSAGIYSLDSASVTGRSFSTTSGYQIGGGGQGFFNLATYNIVVGTQVPAGNILFYAAVKCSTSTTATLAVISNYTSIGSGSFACGTSYTTASVTVNLSTYSGQSLGFSVTPTTGTFQVGWAAIRPFQGDYNGKQPVLNATAISVTGSGAAVPSGPGSGVTSGHLVCYTGTNGQQQDCGVGLPLTGTTGSIGGSALAAGACTSGTVSITGATTTMAVIATPAAYPGDGMAWRPYVSSSGVVTVKVCAGIAGTPTASTYKVRVIP